MTTRKLIPIGDHILVEPVARTNDPDARIVIPETVKEPPVEGIVIVLGSGRGPEGKTLPFEVKVGDRVLFHQHAGTIIRNEPNDLKLLKRDEILAVFAETGEPALTVCAEA